MIGFLLTFCLYVTTVFLAIIPAFGISYTGAEESPIYVITVLGTNALTVGYIFYQELFHRERARGSLKFYLIPLIILFLYFAELAFGGIYETSNTNKIIQYFFAYSASGIIIGTYCYRYDKFYLIARNLEPLAILCTIGLTVSLPSMYAEDEISSTIGGGGSHQTISYVSAICFGIFLIGLRLKGDMRLKYKVFASKYYRPIALIMMIVNAVICIVGGGRGGVILLIANIILSLFYFSRENFWKTIFLITLGGIAFYFMSTNVSLWGIDEMFQKGFERAFSFIGSNGIDMSETSERDVVYAIAGKLISSKPILGYGLFHQYDICKEYISQPYCHNLFYEWLLQGGIFYFVFWLTVIVCLFYKSHHLILQGSYHLIAIITYPFIMLMFSGSYLMTPLYWFAIAYVFGASANTHKEEHNCKSIKIN